MPVKIGSTKKKERCPARKFWRELTEVWFVFYREKFQQEPTFTRTSAPRDLGYIVDDLEKRAEAMEIEWTKEVAEMSLRVYFKVAYEYFPWLRERFMLFQMWRQHDAIIQKIQSIKNGKQSASKEGFTRDGVMEEFNRRYNKTGND